jgi:hypothetical protein
VVEGRQRRSQQQHQAMAAAAVATLTAALLPAAVGLGWRCARLGRRSGRGLWGVVARRERGRREEEEERQEGAAAPGDGRRRHHTSAQRLLVSAPAHAIIVSSRLLPLNNPDARLLSHSVFARPQGKSLPLALKKPRAFLDLLRGEKKTALARAQTKATHHLPGFALRCKPPRSTRCCSPAAPRAR